MAAPRTEDVQAVLRRSQRRWESDFSYANSHRKFTDNITNPKFLLDRVPAMPSNPKLEQVPNGSLLEARGRATWTYQPNAKCDLSESVIMKELTVGFSFATKFTAEGSGFRNWEDTCNIRDKGSSATGNHLAVLIPCWAYILSKLLVERQGGLMEYTNVSAPSTDESVNSKCPNYRMYVGDAEFKEARWWKAILAPGQGWRSIMHSSTDTIYLAPWSMEYHGDTKFFIDISTTISCADRIWNAFPPSSEEALQYLTSYCTLHALGTQYFAALSAVLTLPLQNLLGRKVQLPKPLMVRPSRKSSPLPDVREQFLDLPYLVTLSCAIRIVSSALWAAFWEPGIDCNLASAWLSPALNVLSPLIDTNNHEMLVRTLARHRPMAGPLWLGAVLTGLSRDIPHFLQTLEAPYARPDSLASAWLGFPQLFMDTPGIGAYKYDGKYIRRADRWRLLHDVGTQPYCSTPLSSWQPFGKMPLSTVELDVMAHVECKRHEKQYIRWEWLGTDGIYVLGAERTSTDSVLDHFNSRLTETMAAIRSKIAWLAAGCLGWKETDRSTLRPSRMAGSVPLGVQSSEEGGVPNATKLTGDLSFLESDSRQRASIAATRSIFAWVTVGGEGWGESERPIFEHPWMADLIPSDTDESASDGSWERNDNSD